VSINTDRTTAQRPHSMHDGTFGRGVRVPSCVRSPSGYCSPLAWNRKQDKLMQICISPLI